MAAPQLITKHCTLVGMTRLELATSPPPAARATNCATSRYLIILPLAKRIPRVARPSPQRRGHVPRPPDFTIESIAFIGKSVSELPLAVLTTNCATSRYLIILPLAERIPRVARPSPQRRGHVPRPPDFTIESIAFIGKSVSELPLAVLTTNSALVPISYYFTTC